MLSLTVALLVGCADSPSDSGSARFAVSAPQSLSSSIARVLIISGGPDIRSVGVDLVQTNGVWGGTIGNLPVGTDRAFAARAFDASGTLLFAGSAAGVTISADQTTLVAITLQQVDPPPPFENEAPVIDSLVTSSTSVFPGGFIFLTATAHDPNPDDTLTYTWSATAGTFSSPSEAFTTWMAPESMGIQKLTFTVTDSRGLSSSITLAVNVVFDEVGEAELAISFNSSPRVDTMEATPTWLVVGQPALVSVSASDPDGDSLSYSWSATCAGSFSDAWSNTTQFTPAILPAGACNNCRLTVSVSDGRGGQTTGTVALCVSNAPETQRFEPAILRSYRSSDTATPGQVLTFEVFASDPQGAPLYFAWEANSGWPGTPTRDGSRSRITWTAPACVSAPPSITVTVRNTFGLTATRSFTVAGLPACPPVGSWEPTGSMTQTRHDHTATLLTDGTVLVSGGVVDDDIWEPGGDVAYKTAEVYDPVTGTWSVTGSMAEGRANHTATRLPDGRVLVVGGSSDHLPTAELYDPATGTWSATGSMAEHREEHTATRLPDGRVLIVGGWSGSGHLATAEVYDPATGTFSPTGSMAAPREEHTATLLPDGKVLVVGGWSGSGHLVTAEVYDPATGTFSPTGSMAEPREAHTATLLLNGKVLVAGGALGQLPTAELYDPATGTFSPTGSMAEGHDSHTATLLPDGRVLVAGGFGDMLYGAHELAEVYDPASGTWSSAGAMATRRGSHTAVLLLNGKVLVAGGYTPDGNYQYAEAELYTAWSP
ncbi:kelch-like protein [Pyxidicoccus fallax]|uniref:Kelch-like protein n=1 Tax=Pyxidicoccus fallax TaxID=394095 RepID=A0A848LRV0_9BACT|nr:kelch repeat-containing protein [Pyxidicoccus fallax]NMO20668.1 kelch-like protein [Pyxidicoccus fallax]NPC84896.1 kelch-like protein [Pyxidicoccus fallax]